jgi:threonine/homoserine/homoserine lactone efflux protein
VLSIEFLITSLVVVLIPGTGVIYTVAVGVFMGTRASLFAALGCTLGIIPSIIACVMGLALLIHTSALAFQWLKYAGVAYLLYLAWSMLRAGDNALLSEKQISANPWSIAVKGFLINILNPKLTVFFLAFLPQFVPAQTAQPTQSMLLLGAVFMLMTLVVFVIYGLLATSVREYIISSKKVSTYLQRFFAGSFAALGLKLALTSRD